jgi:hypothetical protein
MLRDGGHPKGTWMTPLLRKGLARSSHAALSGCGQLSDSSGTAIANTVPGGSRTSTVHRCDNQKPGPVLADRRSRPATPVAAVVRLEHTLLATAPGGLEENIQ